MPGENAGNALLVLLVYDESSSLAVNFFSEIALHKPAAPTESTQAYFVAVQNQDIQQVFNLNPTSPQLPRTPAAISFDRFREMSDAAYERLDEPVAYRSYGEIVERLDRNDENKPRFAIFTGD
jgi:hypothetical protein